MGVGRGGNDTTPERTHVHKTSEMPRTGLINRRRLGYNGKDFVFGTWNVRKLYKTGALISLLSQLKEYKLAITALQETRWQDKDIMDMKSHTLFNGGKERGTREFEVAFVVERNMKRNTLSLRSSLSVSEKVSHPYKITGKIIVLYILIFKFFG